MKHSFRGNTDGLRWAEGVWGHADIASRVKRGIRFWGVSAGRHVMMHIPLFGQRKGWFKVNLYGKYNKILETSGYTQCLGEVKKHLLRFGVPEAEL
jgi:hypothetical protein